MRHLIGMVTVFLSLQTLAGTQASATASELADDKLAGALWRIAVVTQTRIGFESVEFVRLHRLTDVPEFPISSRHQALKAAVDGDVRYEWRTLGDFVVVRPKGAWSDSDNPFNRPVRNLLIENAMSSGVLFSLRDFIYTNKFTILPNQHGIPVSFDVPSGTVIDVLNRLLEASDTVFWNVSYRPNAKPDRRFPRWDLLMQLMDASLIRHLTESDRASVVK